MLLRRKTELRLRLTRPGLVLRTALRRPSLGQSSRLKWGRLRGHQSIQAAGIWRAPTSYRGLEQPLVWHAPGRPVMPGKRPSASQILDRLRRAATESPDAGAKADISREPLKAAPALPSMPAPQPSLQGKPTAKIGRPDAPAKAVVRRKPMKRTAVELQTPLSSGEKSQESRPESKPVHPHRSPPSGTVSEAVPAASGPAVQAKAEDREPATQTLPAQGTGPVPTAPDRTERPVDAGRSLPTPVAPAPERPSAIATSVSKVQPPSVKETELASSLPAEVHSSAPAGPMVQRAQVEGAEQAPTRTTESSSGATLPGPMVEPVPKGEIEPALAPVIPAAAKPSAASEPSSDAERAVKPQATPSAVSGPSTEAERAAKPPSTPLAAMETPVSAKQTTEVQTAVQTLWEEEEPEARTVDKSQPEAPQPVATAQRQSETLGEAEPSPREGPPGPEEGNKTLVSSASMPFPVREVPRKRGIKSVGRSLGRADIRLLPVASDELPGRQSPKPSAALPIRSGPTTVRRAPSLREAADSSAPQSRRAEPPSLILRTPPVAEALPGAMPEAGAAQPVSAWRESSHEGRSSSPGSRAVGSTGQAMRSPVAPTHTIAAGQTALVQTAPEDAGAEVADAAGPGAGEEQSASEAPEVDLDTMAQQVYQILRRRLRVEQERAGRGLG